MKVRTYAIITIRAHIAPYVVITAALVERLTRDHETLNMLANLAMGATCLWLAWIAWRDRVVVMDTLTFRSAYDAIGDVIERHERNEP